MTYFTVATLAILVSMAMLLVRAFKGETVYDRILAVNSFGTKTVLLIALMCFMTGRPDFIDLALVYALMNFISTIAVLRFTRYHDMLDDDDLRARRLSAPIAPAIEEELT